MQDLQQTSNFHFDLLFILTPTGSLNQEASSKFIDHLHPNIKDKIKMVICLDSFVNSESPNELHILHGHLSDHEVVSNKFVEEFKKAAAKKDVVVHVKEPQASINRLSRYIQYEH